MLKEKIHNGKFNYILYRPEHDDGRKKPLILFLHGAGERGDNLDAVTVNGLHIIDDNHLDYNCYIVAPQCPYDDFWAARIESLYSFLTEIINTYNIDKNRISLTGISMGGYGAWFLAMAHPEVFSALAPCCGGGMPWNAHVLKMPVKAFHGELDKTVYPYNSTDMIEAIKNSPEHSDDVSVTVYAGVAHNSWVLAYTDELFKWLISKSK